MDAIFCIYEYSVHITNAYSKHLWIIAGEYWWHSISVRIMHLNYNCIWWCDTIHSSIFANAVVIHSALIVSSLGMLGCWSLLLWRLEMNVISSFLSAFRLSYRFHVLFITYMYICRTSIFILYDVRTPSERVYLCRITSSLTYYTIVLVLNMFSIQYRLSWRSENCYFCFFCVCR